MSPAPRRYSPSGRSVFFSTYQHDSKFRAVPVVPTSYRTDTEYGGWTPYRSHRAHPLSQILAHQDEGRPIIRVGVAAANFRHRLLDFGNKFNPVVTIEEYTGFFLSIILGLGVSFELPILIFFLALFGIVSPRFLWKNIRYAILAVFVVAAVICPSPDPSTMCIYAVPMLGLYIVGIGVAWWVHPSRRKAKEAKENA